MELIVDCRKDCKKQNIFEMFSGKIWKIFDNPAGLLLAFALTATVLYLPLIFWDAIPCRDVANRYVPMAEAFARGDFMYAFHPRCQMLHTTIAGIIAWFGCDAFLACKLTSFIFYLLTALPLFFLCRRVFGYRVSKWVIWGFAFASPLISSLAVTGLRDAAKMFVLMLMAHAVTAIFQQRHKLWYYIYAGIAAGLAICVRNDLLAVTLVFLFICGLLDRSEHCWIWRSLLGVVVALAVGTLELFANYSVTGYVIPGARYYKIFTQWLKIQPDWLTVIAKVILPMFVLYIAGVYATVKIWSFRAGKWFFRIALIAALIALNVRIVVLAIAIPEQAGDFFNSVMGGVSWVFFPLAVIGAGLRTLKRQWSREETLLAILFVIFELLVIFQIILHDNYLYTSERYLLTAVPLLLPWSWCALEQLWKYVAGFLHLPCQEKFFAGLVGVFIMLGIYCAYRGEINEHTRPREIHNTQAVKAIAEVIKTEKRSFHSPTIEVMHYKSNVRPRVYFDCPERLQVAVFAGGGSRAVRASEMDLLVTGANKTLPVLKRQFKFIKSARKIGSEIVFRKEKLQIWKVIRK